jgi:glycyl-tRNA synthetase beta chain
MPTATPGTLAQRRRRDRQLCRAQAEIARQLAAAAARWAAAARPIEDEALLDEVTALVERPNVLICAFERSSSTCRRSASS